MKKTYVEYTDEQWKELNEKFSNWCSRNDAKNKKSIVQLILEDYDDDHNNKQG